MRIVVALGGNALGNTPEEQKQLVKETVKPLADLIDSGHEVIITHGNGPQVGMIFSAFQTASETNSHLPEMPFPECGAMSQGYIGYHLQNALRTELLNRNLKPNVATIVTQVEVSIDDPAFQNPTKPIGAFYSEKEAKILEETQNYVMKEDAGRGYRRVVPSPKPQAIVELEAVKQMVANGFTVITVGGGGIPVVRKDNVLYGVPAVIDKDHASSLLADLIEADRLIILTSVPYVALNYGTKEQVNLTRLSVSEAKNYLQEGHFKSGSMKPKIEAALAFVDHMPNRKAIIASLKDAKMAVEEKTGTLIYYKE